MSLPGETLLRAGIDPMSPAEFFAERFLRPRETSVWQAAVDMELDENTLEAFLAGMVEVDSRLARKLADFTGTTAQFWLNMQYGRNLSRAQVELQSSRPG